MDKLNKWLTLLANIGVIAGLIFVAFQIQQNTAQMRLDASFSVNLSLNSLNSAIYQDSSFASVYLKGCNSYNDLNDLEKARFKAYAFDMLNLYIFANKLKEQDLRNIHTDISEVMKDRFQNNPGLREFLVSIKEEWAAGDGLYQKLLSD